MSHALTGWIIVTLLFGAIGIAAVWSRTSSVIRGLAVAAFFIASPVVGLVAATGLGWAVPIIPYVTAIGGDYRVLGVKLEQGVAIYVLIDSGAGEPRYYRLPWDQQKADEIQNMMDNPESGGVAVRIPYEFSWDTNTAQFHELPQPPALPPKLEQEKKVPRFNA